MRGCRNQRTGRVIKMNECDNAGRVNLRGFANPGGLSAGNNAVIL